MQNDSFRRMTRTIKVTFWLSILILVSSGLAEATAIIRIVDPVNLRIVVAADSKELRLKENEPSVALSTCKIARIDENAFWVASGLPRTDKFNAFTMFSEAYKKQNDVRKALDSTERSIREALETSLADARKNYPKTYKRFFEGRKTLEIMTFGFERGSLFYYSRVFEEDSSTLKINRYDCPGKACSPTAHIVFAGDTTGIDRYYKEHPPSSSPDLLSWIRSAMDAAIKAEPVTVGGPIDIIQVEQKAATWVQVRNECSK